MFIVYKYNFGSDALNFKNKNLPVATNVIICTFSLLLINNHDCCVPLEFVDEH